MWWGTEGIWQTDHQCKTGKCFLVGSTYQAARMTAQNMLARNGRGRGRFYPGATGPNRNRRDLSPDTTFTRCSRSFDQRLTLVRTDT
jgi:hypothetical protein